MYGAEIVPDGGKKKPRMINDPCCHIIHTLCWDVFIMAFVYLIVLIMWI